MNRRTLLIADADEQAADELSRILDTLGLATVVARTQADVLVALEATERKLDGVFLDLSTPSMGGAQILQSVRNLAPDLPVVVCASEGGKADYVQAIRARCVDWIDKPVDSASVVEAVKRLAREGRRGAPRAVTGEMPPPVNRVITGPQPGPS